MVTPRVSPVLAQLARDDAMRNTLGRGAYVVDEHGCLVDMNAAAEDLLGWTAAELRGRNMHHAIHYLRPDGAPYPERECSLLGVIESGVAFGETHDAFVRKDGGLLAVAYVSSPVMVDDDVVGAVLAFWPR